MIPSASNPDRPGRPADDFIVFRCTFCNHKLRAAASDAGKKRRCPNCRNLVPVPHRRQENAPAARQTDPAFFAGFPITKVEQTQPPRRRYLWPVDVLLYPCNRHGLAMMGIFVGIPLFIDILALLVLAVAGIMTILISIPGIVVKIVLALYACWYFTECIRDSAAGGLRAPDVLVNAPSIGDMGWQTVRVLFCFLFFVAPAFIYYNFARTPDAIFWILLATGVFVFPMGLLSTIMFDSVFGMSPLVVFASIMSVFLPYLGLLLLACASVCLVVLTGYFYAKHIPLRFLLTAVLVWIFMLDSHLIGRFFFRYRDRLDWEV